MRKRGVSLFEIIIVIGIFAAVAVLTTRSTFLTLRGARKSDAQIRVKENLEYGVSVIERQLRNADIITSATNCDGATKLTRVDYVDSEGNSSFFACQSVGATSGYIASGSARLTSNEITISNCSFVCSAQDGPSPTNITINVTGKDLSGTGAESSQVTLSTKVFLRNY